MNRKYMEQALVLAKKGVGKVNPNPLVGAVVVKNDEIIGTGYHKYFGGPHAEVYALDEAGVEARGADLYVTLEPCSHFGKTPPCAKKVIEMGIKRCFIACLDPNPLVAGNGVKMLEEAGIEVKTGVLENKAKDMNKVFMKYMTENKSYLFIKTGITLDGKIATKSYNSKWITNEQSRHEVQRLRNEYMGIMIGINTLVQDNPSLTSRIQDGRDPYRIIVDPRLDIPMGAKILDYEDNKTVIVTSTFNKTNEKIEYLEKQGVQFIYLSAYDFKLDDILTETAKLGIDGIMLEGGSNLISRAFMEDAIDGGKIFIAPKILGDSMSIPFVDGFSINKIADGIQLQNVKFEIYGDNIAVCFNR